MRTQKYMFSWQLEKSEGQLFYIFVNGNLEGILKEFLSLNYKVKFALMKFGCRESETFRTGLI